VDWSPARRSRILTGMTIMEIPTTHAHWTGADSSGHWILTAEQLTPTLRDRAVEADANGTFVAEQIAELRRNGLTAMLVPDALGGGGASFRDTCAVLADLAHGCPSTSLTLSMHSHLVAAQVWRHLRDLPAPALAKVAGGAVLVSTGASDWMESNGSSTRVDGGYRVTARKSPASGAPGGDVVVTSFRHDGPDGAQVVHASVPFAAPGVSIEQTWDTMGMRATGSETVVFDDVFVPDAAVALVRPAGQWHPVWATVLGVALPLIMSTYVGVAEAAANRAIELARPRAERPDIASLIGRMGNRLTVARDTVRAMIDAADDLRFDNTLDHASLSLTRKTNAAEAVVDVVRLAMEVSGGHGFGRGSGIERLFRDAHGAAYHPLPAAQQELFSGRVALGMLPF